MKRGPGVSKRFLRTLWLPAAPGDVMSVQVSHIAGALVVAIHDLSHLDVVSSFARQLAPTQPAAVVVDVSAMTMAPSGGAELLAARVRAAAAECRSHRWSLVAARLTARRILRHLVADTTVGVFPSVDAALSAVTPGHGSSSGAAQ